MRVEYRKGDHFEAGEWFPKPDPPLKAGDKLRVVRAFSTLGGEHYEIWDTLEIAGFTPAAPHNRITTEGNLLIRGKNGRVSAWSNVEWILHQGLLGRD